MPTFDSPVLPRQTIWYLLLLGIVALGFGAQVLLALALRALPGRSALLTSTGVEKAGRASLLLYLQLPLAMVFDRVVFLVRAPLSELR